MPKSFDVVLHGFIYGAVTYGNSTVVRGVCDRERCSSTALRTLVRTSIGELSDCSALVDAIEQLSSSLPGLEVSAECCHDVPASPAREPDNITTGIAPRPVTLVCTESASFVVFDVT